MSKKEKLIKKFTTIPVKSDLTYSDLKTLLEVWDIKKLKAVAQG